MNRFNEQHPQYALNDDDDEDDEEGYLDPNELEIIDDETWEPTDEDIFLYANKLGFDIENDPDELFEIAYSFLKCPLPQGWKRAIYKETKELMYVNMEDGDIELVTEIEEMARHAYEERKAEMIKMGKIKTGNNDIMGIGNNNADSSGKVVPNKKIPPINNPLTKSNSGAGSKGNPLNPINKQKSANNVSSSQTQSTNTGVGTNDILNKQNKQQTKEQAKQSSQGILNLHTGGASMSELDEDDFDDEFDSDKQNGDLSNFLNMKKKEIEELHKESQKKNNSSNSKSNINNKLLQKKNDDDEYSQLNQSKDNEAEPEIDEISNAFDNSNISFTDNSEMGVKNNDNNINNNTDSSFPTNKITPVRNPSFKPSTQKPLSSNSQVMSLEEKKKEFFNSKLNDLKAYEVQLRDKYTKAKQAYKKKKSELKLKLQDENKVKLNKEKEKLEKANKDKIKLYISQIENNNKKELDKYKKEIETQFKNDNNNNNNDKSVQDKINTLLKQKQSLQKEIDSFKNSQRQRESNNKQKYQIEFAKTKSILDDKKEIEKNNILKQHELKLKALQIEKEKEFNKYITNTNTDSYKYSQLNPNKLCESISLSDLNKELKKSKVFETYEKALQDDYELNCKNIEHDFTLTQTKELNAFTQSMNLTTQDKIKHIHKQMNDLENDYFMSLSKLREETTQMSQANDVMMKDKFDKTLNQYEYVKNKIINDDNEVIHKIITNIKELILNENDLDELELKVEECLMNIYDEFMIKAQRIKNEFDLVENEFIYKMHAINYVMDVVGYVNKCIIENPIVSAVNTISNNGDDDNKNNLIHNESNYINEDKVNHNALIDKVMLYAKNKLDQYKFKYNQEKGNKLYSFLIVLNDNYNVNSSSTPNLYGSYNHINNNNSIQNIKHIQNNTNNNSHNNINNNRLNSSNHFQLPLSPKDRVHSSRYNNANNDINGNTNYIISEEDDDQNSSHQQLPENENFINSNNNNNMNNDLNCYVLDGSSNITIPLLSDYTIQLFDNEELSMYTDITLFLKNEYTKIEEVKQMQKENNSRQINTKLNLLILDKIKIYTEDTFDYIQSRIQKKDKVTKQIFKEKLNLLLSNINDYKKNFYIELPRTFNKGLSPPKVGITMKNNYVGVYGNIK